MIAVSDAWKELHERLLLPEGHIEIRCEITEVGLREIASASGSDEAILSDVAKVTDDEDPDVKYATNELNFWVLDGSMSIAPDSAPYESAGYISDTSESGSVTLTLPEAREVVIPGVTITWSSLYGEYPTAFTVTAKKDDETVAELTVTDNADKVSVVDLELVDYDSVTVTVHSWCLPYRRARIESVALGHTLTLNKSDILSYVHEQQGDLLSAEIPKYSIEFSLNNIDGRWNPSNPVGMEKYLSERQKLTVRYGFTMDDDTVEWIKAGTFYLSEWYTPSNGIEARFTARDVFEFVLNAENKTPQSDSLTGHLERAAALLPEEAVVEVDSSLDDYTADYKGDGTSAIIFQKSANASGGVLRYDREGVTHVEPLDMGETGYTIPLMLSYSYPEIALSKPLKKVAVAYGENSTYELPVAVSGEVQTVNNDFITTAAQAEQVALLVRDTLETRKTVKGEFRADPRFDLFDIVSVETKYGTIVGVALTNIKYTFNGAFRCTYEGRVLNGTGVHLDEFILDESILA